MPAAGSYYFSVSAVVQKCGPEICCANLVFGYGPTGFPFSAADVSVLRCFTLHYRAVPTASRLTRTRNWNE